MNTNSISPNIPNNVILRGDCIDVMHRMPSNSVDFILTDPPYLVNYCDRSGRSIQNDANESWLKPAMAEAYRLLKQDRVAVMFYGWTKVDAFFQAWRDAGFQPVGPLVFRKSYSSKSRFLRYYHEQAFLLAKGRPPLPKQPLADVLDMPYTGNKLHPTQKPVTALIPLVAASRHQMKWSSIPSPGAEVPVRRLYSPIAGILELKWPRRISSGPAQEWNG